MRIILKYSVRFGMSAALRSTLGKLTGLRPVSALLLSLGLLAQAQAQGVLNVYSARHYDADEALYRGFTDATGIEVQIRQGDSDELVERMRREGRASPADILITVDAGRLWRAEQAGVLQAVDSPLLEQAIPAHLRHPEGKWFGFSQRMRLIYVNADAVEPAAITRYEDLADAAWKGQICIRSSNNIYNQSLLASLIAHDGAEAATAWARGLMNNLARRPVGGDTDQLLGVASGECDIAVANHYYYVRLAQSSDPAQRAAAEKLTVIFPNQDDRGVHVNIGGAALAAHAPNRANAVRFLEYLASPEAQAIFAVANYELPVVDGSVQDPLVESWHTIKRDMLDVTVLGVHNPEAVRVADRAGWR
jgi:iron(III) transport system substrate-binding protein